MVVDPMSVNYNLSRIANISVVDNPADLLHWWNLSMQGFGIFVILGVIGFVLFLAMRKFVDSDSEALSYAGYIVTVAALFLFLIKTSDGEKILTWGYFLIIILVTAIANFLNFTNRKF